MSYNNHGDRDRDDVKLLEMPNVRNMQGRHMMRFDPNTGGPIVNVTQPTAPHSAQVGIVLTETPSDSDIIEIKGSKSQRVCCISAYKHTSRIWHNPGDSVLHFEEKDGLVCCPGSRKAGTQALSDISMIDILHKRPTNYLLFAILFFILSIVFFVKYDKSGDTDKHASNNTDPYDPYSNQTSTTHHKKEKLYLYACLLCVLIAIVLLYMYYILQKAYVGFYHASAPANTWYGCLLCDPWHAMILPSSSVGFFTTKYNKLKEEVDCLTERVSAMRQKESGIIRDALM